ncbi:MAG: hypothetical protein M1838_005696 [Thelocarpon superellum]|nr:MAG: hypothetical protein M1838_005696 [Thelocarpon superellum]
MEPIESISISYTNFPILPPQNPALNYVANKLLGDGSIKLSCQNCSLVGDMAISYGSVNMTSSKALSEMVSALTGQVQVTVQNLSGHIELRTEISASKSMDFTAHLPQIPLTPFEIPGFALIGPVVDPQIVGSLTLSSDVDFIYGFDVSVSVYYFFGPLSLNPRS